jgi:hypothetical protein
MRCPLSVGAVVRDGQRGHLQSHGTEGFDRPVLYPTVAIVMRKAAAFESVPQCRLLGRTETLKRQRKRFQLELEITGDAI